MKLGFVISDTELDLGDKYICGSYEDSLEYPDLPKIIVGMYLANELYSNETDILDRKLPDGVFWTFTKKEQRRYHAEDMEDFKQHCVDRLVENLKYEFVDPLMSTLEENKAKFDEIKAKGDLTTYYNKDMVYIHVDGTVYGINMMFYEYLGLSRDTMLDKLKAISKVFLVEEDIIIEYKDYLERLDNQERFVPHLYSIINYVK